MMNHQKLEIEKIVRRDPRYAPEAYEFVFAALVHTQEQLGRVPPTAGKGPQRDYHVTIRELLEGVCDYARLEFGLLARTVFRLWGIDKTDDFGEIFFNLVAAGQMSKRSEDRREEFDGLFDLDLALTDGYRIDMRDEAEEAS